MFSVVIPTYNRPNATINALNSVLDQTSQEFEVIIIDDASDNIDELVEYINELGDHRINLVQHNINRNGAAAPCRPPREDRVSTGAVDPGGAAAARRGTAVGYVLFRQPDERMRRG